MQVLLGTFNMRNTDTTKARLEFLKNIQKIRDAYNKNPKLCLECKSRISYKQKLMGNKFCNRSCAAKHNNKKYKEINGHGRNTKGNNGGHPCPICGTTIYTRNKFCNNKCRIKHINTQSIEFIKQKIKNNEYIHREIIKKYLLLTREYKCFKCNRTKWNNYPIPLEAHHKDGNYKNNSDENLELICPNCHALTDTYKGKNRGNGRGDYKRRT